MFLRLGADGGVLRSEGADEELAAVVANARRLGRLAGQLLGMDPFVAMECTLASGRLLIYDEDDGETVALRVRNESSLESLRERLGL
jgi:predicted regulator of Ras-like GTPase activity (Roadblock/LC7/MglB family)